MPRLHNRQMSSQKIPMMAWERTKPTSIEWCEEATSGLVSEAQSVARLRLKEEAV